MFQFLKKKSINSGKFKHFDAKAFDFWIGLMGSHMVTSTLSVSSKGQRERVLLDSTWFLEISWIQTMWLSQMHCSHRDNDKHMGTLMRPICTRVSVSSQVTWLTRPQSINKKQCSPMNKSRIRYTLGLPRNYFDAFFNEKYSKSINQTL